MRWKRRGTIGSGWAPLHGYSSDDTVVRVGCLVRQIIKTAGLAGPLHVARLRVGTAHLLAGTALVLFHLLCPLRPALPCLPFQLLQSLLLIGVQPLPIVPRLFQRIYLLLRGPGRVGLDMGGIRHRQPSAHQTFFHTLAHHFLEQTPEHLPKRRLPPPQLADRTVVWHSKEMQLKYHMVTIEDLVPENHFLRKLEAALDLSFVYEETAHLYSRRYGRAPIDPVVMVKYLLLGFLYGIPSERQIEVRCADSSLPFQLLQSLLLIGVQPLPIVPHLFQRIYLLLRGLDLSFVYEETAHLYSRRYGRAPIDPVVMVKYLLLGFSLSLPCDILTAFPRPPCSNYTIFRAIWGHFVNS